MPKWLKILIGLLAVVIVIIIAFLVYMNTAFISKEEAKINLAKHINIDEEDIYFENVDFEMDNNQYEVDFYYNNQEYEAKIDAKEGKIIYTNFTTNNKTGSNNQNGNGNQNSNSTQEEITLEEAKQIALKHANLNENDVTLVKAEIEHDGEGMYEIEWRDATYEYEFDISRTGNVLHYDKDRIHD